MIFTLDADNDRLVWLGINTASFQGVVGELILNPVVGVRWQLVERIVSETSQRAVHSYVPPTVMSTLQDLGPWVPERQWSFFRDADNTTVAEEVVQDLLKYGMPWVEKYLELDGVIEWLEARWKNDHNARFRWPVALWVAGQPDSALTAITKVDELIGARENPATRDLGGFLDRLAVRIATEPIPVSNK